LGLVELFIDKVTLSLGLLSPPCPLFLQSNEVLIKSQYEMLKSAFNAQGLRLIIVMIDETLSNFIKRKHP